jgi:hypothetical protein
MEQIPIMSPTKEKQPAKPVKYGYFDNVFAILKARQHPFVLVEESALHWMGLRVCSKEVSLNFLS